MTPENIFILSLIFLRPSVCSVDESPVLWRLSSGQYLILRLGPWHPGIHFQDFIEIIQRLSLLAQPNPGVGQETKRVQAVNPLCLLREDPLEVNDSLGVPLQVEANERNRTEGEERNRTE